MPSSGPRGFTVFRRPGFPPAAVATAVVCLLSLFWWLAVSASAGKSQTSDELPHITAGYAYDHFGDFRFQPENGNLPQRVFGLAGLAAGARFPTDEEHWKHASVWQLGWDYFYGLDNPIDRIVQTSRALNALFGVALGLLIFFAARAQFGDSGGLLALAFYALAPNFLANSALATSDMCATFFLTLAPWLFWRHLEKRDLRSGLCAGLATGLALVAKFNGLLVVPIYVALGLADALLRTEGPWAIRARRFFGSFFLGLGQAAAGFAIIWAFYNFHYSVRGPGTPEFVAFPWDITPLVPALGIKRVLVETAISWHLLPEAWLNGLIFVLAGEVARPAFFAGEHSQYGWWQFFPALFLTKTTLAMLGALLVALGATLYRWRRSLTAARREWLIAACPIALSSLVVAYVAIRSHLNIGDRHILAAYPVLFVALGILATHRWLALAALVLLTGHAAASFAIRPDYLAAYNAFAGGPDQARHLFTDSSLDWGQDLPALRDWLATHRRPGEKFFLGYFGNAWPPHYGVRPDQFLPASNYIARPPLAPYDYEPGLYCVSASLLSEVYSSYRGQWTPAFERIWQDYRTKPPTPDDYRQFDEIRFARLCKYLQLRRPDSNVGHSIFIYRLTAADLQAALANPATGAYRMRPQ